MFKRLCCLLCVFGILGAWLMIIPAQRARSANLLNGTALFSTPRLSFYGRLNPGNIAGNSIVVLSQHPSSAADAGSTSSANLFEGDRVLIDQTQYEVATPNSTGSAVFTIDGLPSTPGVSALTTANDDAGDRVIASRSASLTVTFETVTGLTDSRVRLLLPDGSTSNGSPSVAANDGIPDRDGWDLTGSTSNLQVSCTVDDGNGLTDHVTGQTQSITSNQTIGAGTFHAFVCDFTGEPVIPSGSIVVMTITSSAQGTAAGYSGPINPAPAVGHTVGFADNYNLIAQHLDSGNNVIDSTTFANAMIESVLVTAIVPPQITFRILGVSASNTNYCGITTSVATTPTLVPFGELLINTFRYAAQELVVSTNAQDGYVVTARADNQIHRNDAACVGDATTGGCIPDATGDGGSFTMSHTQQDLWVAPTANGFGYTLDSNSLSSSNPSSMAFEHNTSLNDCAGASGSCWRQFADAENAVTEDPVTIFSNSTVASDNSAVVCYKVSISAIQEAGNDYSTGVTYRATATF